MDFDMTYILNNISELCKEKCVSRSTMLSECGLNDSLIDNMKRGRKPSIDKIAAIANYFNVTIDDLCSEFMDDDKEPAPDITIISSTEQRILDAFRKMDEFERAELLVIVKNFETKYAALEKSAENA